MQPDDIFSWWKDWFLHLPDMLQLLPSWFVVSILMTLLEVVLYMRSRQGFENTAIVSTTESLELSAEQTVLDSAPVESRIVMIESTQQYKTIYRLTSEGISEEIVRQSFKELAEGIADNLLKVHKSYMVAADLIERIERDGRDYYLILQHIAKPIPVGRNKLEEVRAVLRS